MGPLLATSCPRSKSLWGWQGVANWNVFYSLTLQVLGLWLFFLQTVLSLLSVDAELKRWARSTSGCWTDGYKTWESSLMSIFTQRRPLSVFDRDRSGRGAIMVWRRPLSVPLQKSSGALGFNYLCFISGSSLITFHFIPVNWVFVGQELFSINLWIPSTLGST